MPVEPRLAFFIVFVALIGLYLWRERDNFDRHGIVFLRRTQTGIKQIDQLAKRLPKFWKWYGNAGVLTAVLSMGGSAVLMGYAFFDMMASKSVESGPSLILPGLVSENQFQAGASFIPVEYWVIGVALTVFVHEISHGIIARAEDMEISSIGMGFLAIIPIGFVEPEGSNQGEELVDMEEAWTGGDWKSRLKVVSAGSFANYITAGIFFLLATGLTAALTQPSGLIYQAQEGYPAQEAGMNNGTIYEINGEKVGTVKELKEATGSLEPGDQVSVWSSEGNFTFETADRENFDGGYMGIRVGQQKVIKDRYSGYQAGLQWFTSLLFTVSMLNFLIGLFNMLPIKPLDGGLFAETLIEEYWGEENVSYLHKFTLAVWALLISALVFGIITML